MGGSNSRTSPARRAVPVALIVALVATLLAWPTPARAQVNAQTCKGAWQRFTTAKAAYDAKQGDPAALWREFSAAFSFMTDCMNLGYDVGMPPGVTPGSVTGPGSSGTGGQPGTSTPAVATTAVLDEWRLGVRAESPGYLGAAAEIHDSIQVTYYDAAELAAKTKMTQGVTVSGIVRDPTGQPVAGVRVGLEGRAGTTTSPAPSASSTTTDGQGRYRLAFSVTDLDSLPSQPPTPIDWTVDLMVEPVLEITPRELAFRHGEPSIQVFSVRNRGTGQVTISTMRLSGTIDPPAELRVRGGNLVVSGSESRRFVLAPGGVANIEVSWTAGAYPERVDLVPEDVSLGTPSVWLRPTGSLTAEAVVKQYYTDLLAYLARLDQSAAAPPGGAGTPAPGAGAPPAGAGTSPPAAGTGTTVPAEIPPLLRDDQWIADWARKNADRIDALDKRWQQTAVAKAVQAKVVEPLPGIPATVQTGPTQSAVIINIHGGTSSLQIVAGGSQVTVNPPPEKLGPQGAQALMSRADDGALDQPVMLDDGKIFSDAGLDDSDWLPSYLDTALDYVDSGNRWALEWLVPKAVRVGVEKASETAFGIGAGIRTGIDAIVTNVCAVFTGGTQYEVAHDRQSRVTTVTVFEGTVRIVPYSDPDAPLVLRAGQRVRIGPNGAEQVLEVPREVLEAMADPYAEPLLGLNPVSMRRVTRWVEEGGDIPTVVSSDLQPAPMPVAGGPASALPAIADADVYAYSYRNWNRTNVGANVALTAGWNPTGGEKRAYLRFDLTGAPVAGYASLRLYHAGTSGAAGRSLGVYRVTGPWQEGRGIYESGTSEQTAAPGELSWEQQPPFDPTPVAVFTPAQPQQWLEIEVTELVRQWQTGAPNYGLVIKVTEAPGSGGEVQYQFGSRETPDPAHRPELRTRAAASSARDRRDVGGRTSERVGSGPIGMGPPVITVALHRCDPASVRPVPAVRHAPIARQTPATPEQIAEAVRRMSREYGTAAAGWDLESFEAHRQGYDDHRRMLLESLLAQSRLCWGDSTAEVEDLRDLYAMQIPTLEYLAAAPTFEETLSPLRHLHLLLVEGAPWSAAPEGALLEQVAPGVDLGQALERDDPWIVSAALFLARRDSDRLSVPQVLGRWARGGRTWDEECTQQALLYLAAQPGIDLSTLAPDNAWIRSALDRLTAPPENRCLLQVRAFGMLPRAVEPELFVPSASAMHFEPGRGVEGGSGGTYLLSPGRYDVRYLQGQAHSHKYPIECRAGVVVRLVLGITYGV